MFKIHLIHCVCMLVTICPPPACALTTNSNPVQFPPAAYRSGPIRGQGHLQVRANHRSGPLTGQGHLQVRANQKPGQEVAPARANLLAFYWSTDGVCHVIGLAGCCEEGGELIYLFLFFLLIQFPILTKF